MSKSTVFLSLKLKECMEKAAIGEVWKHSKGGSAYEITGYVVNEENLEIHVCYMEIRLSELSSLVPVTWSRPTKHFFDGRFVKLQKKGSVCLT
jgi:hypothetical protein